MASVSKNIFWLSLSRAAALVMLAVAYLVLFRYLGPFGTGQHQFVLAYVTIYAIVIDFGIQQYIIKKMSEEPERQKQYFQNFVAVEIVLSLLVYAALVIVAVLNHYEPVVVHAIMLAGLGTVANGLTYPFLAVMSANHDLKKVAFINFTNSVINTAGIVLTIVFHKYIVFLVANQLVFGLTSLFLYSRFIKKHIPHPQPLRGLLSVDWQLIKNILKAAAPFALLVGFSTIYNRIDIVLITKILGYTETGLYAGAYKFFDLISFFPSVVSFALYPLFVKLMADGKIGEVKITVEKYLRFLIAIALPIGVGASLLALPIITLLSGSKFVAAAPVLAVLVWAPVILIMYIVANSLVISQLTKFAVLITGTNVVINIIGNLILLPRIGIRGAAIMTVVSELVQGLFYFYFLYTKITPFRFGSLLWRPVVASAVMGAWIWKMRQFQLLSLVDASGIRLIVYFGINLLVIVIGGAIVYGLVLWLLKFFHKEDWQFAKSFIRREPAVVE